MKREAQAATVRTHTWAHFPHLVVKAMRQAWRDRRTLNGPDCAECGVNLH